MADAIPRVELSGSLRGRLRRLEGGSGRPTMLLEHGPGRYSLDGDIGGSFGGSLLLPDGRRVESALNLPDNTEVLLQTETGGIAGKGRVSGGRVYMMPEGEQTDPLTDFIQGGTTMLGGLSGALGRLTGVESLENIGDAFREIGDEAEEDRPLGQRLSDMNRLSMGFRAKDAGRMIIGSMPFLAGFRTMAVAGSAVMKGLMNAGKLAIAGRVVGATGDKAAVMLGAAIANSGINASIVADEIRVEMRRMGYTEEEINRAMTNGAFEAGAVSFITGGYLGGRAFGRNRAALEGFTEGIEEYAQADALFRQLGQEFDGAETVAMGFLGGFGTQILMDRSSRVVGQTPFERGLNDYRNRSVRLNRLAQKVGAFKGPKQVDMPLEARQAQAAAGEKVEEQTEKDAVDMVRKLADWAGRETEVMQMTDREVRVSFGKFFPEADYTPEQIKLAVMEVAEEAAQFGKVSDEALRRDFERGDLMVFGMADKGDPDAIAMLDESRRLARQRGERVLPTASRMLMDDQSYAGAQARHMNDAFVSPIDEWQDRRMARHIMEIFPDAHPDAQPPGDKTHDDGIIGETYGDLKPRPPLRNAPIDGVQALRAVKENVPFDRIVERAPQLMDALGLLKEGDENAGGLDLLTRGPRPLFDPVQVALFLSDNPAMAAAVAIRSQDAEVKRAGEAARDALGKLQVRRRTATPEIANLRIIGGDPATVVKDTGKLLGDLKEMDQEAQVALVNLGNAMGRELDGNLARALSGPRGRLLDMASRTGEAPRTLAGFLKLGALPSVYGDVHPETGPRVTRARSAAWHISDRVAAGEASLTDVDERVRPDIVSILTARGVILPQEGAEEGESEGGEAEGPAGPQGTVKQKGPAHEEYDALFGRAVDEVGRVVQAVAETTDDPETLDRVAGLAMAMVMDRIARSRLATEVDSPQAVGRALRNYFEKATEPEATRGREPHPSDKAFAGLPRGTRDRLLTAVSNMSIPLGADIERPMRLARNFVSLAVLVGDKLRNRDGSMEPGGVMLLREWAATVPHEEMVKDIDPAVQDMLTWYAGPTTIQFPQFRGDAQQHVDWMRDRLDKVYAAPLTSEGGPLSVDALGEAPAKLGVKGDPAGVKERMVDLALSGDQRKAFAVGRKVMAALSPEETPDSVQGVLSQIDQAEGEAGAGEPVVLTVPDKAVGDFVAYLGGMVRRMGMPLNKAALAEQREILAGLRDELSRRHGSVVFRGEAVPGSKTKVKPETVKAYKAKQAGKAAEGIRQATGGGKMPAGSAGATAAGSAGRPAAPVAPPSPSSPQPAPATPEPTPPTQPQPAPAAPTPEPTDEEKPTEPEGPVDYRNDGDDFYAVEIVINHHGDTGAALIEWLELLGEETTYSSFELLTIMRDLRHKIKAKGGEFRMFVSREWAGDFKFALDETVDDVVAAIDEINATQREPGDPDDELYERLMNMYNTLMGDIDVALETVPPWPDVKRWRSEWTGTRPAPATPAAPAPTTTVTTGKATREYYTTGEGEPTTDIGKAIAALKSDDEVGAIVTAIGQAALTAEGLDTAESGNRAIVDAMNRVEAVFEDPGEGQPARTHTKFTAIMSMVAALNNVVQSAGPQTAQELYDLMRSGVHDPLGRKAGDFGLTRPGYDDALATAIDLNWVVKERQGHLPHPAVGMTIETEFQDGGWGDPEDDSVSSSMAPRHSLEWAINKLGMTQYRRSLFPRDPRGKVCRDV